MAFRLAPPTLLGLGQHAWASRGESHQPRNPRGGCCRQSAPEADRGHLDTPNGRDSGPEGGACSWRPWALGREVLWLQRARLPAPTPPWPQPCDAGRSRAWRRCKAWPLCGVGLGGGQDHPPLWKRLSFPVSIAPAAGAGRLQGRLRLGARTEGAVTRVLVPFSCSPSVRKGTPLCTRWLRSYGRRTGC